MNLIESRNCILEEVKQNDLMIKKHKRTRKALSYVKNFPFVDCRVTGCVSISEFVSLVCILIGIISPAAIITVCVIAAGIKKYGLISTKKRKKHDKIMLVTNTKLNTNRSSIF